MKRVEKEERAEIAETDWRGHERASSVPVKCYTTIHYTYNQSVSRISI